MRRQVHLTMRAVAVANAMNWQREGVHMDEREDRARARFAQAVELTTATYDQAARDFAERRAEMPAHWAERMEQFNDLLAEEETRRPLPDLGRPGDDISLEDYLRFVPVLDAGCGPGRDARALADHGWPVLGVDISQGMLDESQERTARRLPRGYVRYALMDLRRLELPEASCRGVWCSASLLHLPLHVAPRAAAELTRVARSSAPVAVFLKQREGDIAEQFEPYPTPAASTPRFFAYYTEEEARRLLGDAGLSILDVATVPDGRPGLPPWVSLLARKP
jgi:SAM-dependent methyltransferase